MVRHEAAEALSVLGGDDAYAVLRQFVNDERKEVSETCQVRRVTDRRDPTVLDDEALF